MSRILAALLLAAAVVAGPVAYAGTLPDAAAAASGRIEPVRHADVCMVQNRHGLMKMIPVELDGKVYYGCCQGCVGKLKFNSKVRYATDPVSGRQVDKAQAFIVGHPDGTVTYYESRETAERHLSSIKGK